MHTFWLEIRFGINKDPERERREGDTRFDTKHSKNRGVRLGVSLDDALVNGL